MLGFEKDDRGQAGHRECCSRKLGIAILWLDCDREGGNIAFEVLELCNDGLMACFDRQEIDHFIYLLVLHSLDSRVQTLLLKDTFNLVFATDNSDLVQSYGPLVHVSFSTLGFVMERYWEIQAHEPEEFWTIIVLTTESKELLISVGCEICVAIFFTVLVSCAIAIYEMCVVGVEEPTATDKLDTENVAAGN